MRKLFRVFHLLPILLFSCSQDKTVTGKFLLHDAKQIGIDFQNDVKDLPKHNALVYETFYNGGGVAIGDINNDGLQDLYFSGNQVSDALYLNKGNWQFENITESAGIDNRDSWSTGVTMADINNDGHLDIYVCKSLYDENPDLRVNHLYMNDGTGKFTNQAEKYNLADPWRSQEACFFDYDADNDLDVLIVNQPPNPGLFSPLSGQEWRAKELGVRLMENTGETFVDVSETSGLAHPGYSLSASVVDFNNDGHLDIYISNDYNSPDKLFLNNGNKTFKNIIDHSCGHIAFFSMGTDAADINNDGKNDFLAVDMVSEDPYRLKANMGGMNPDAFWQVANEGGHYQYMYNTLQVQTGMDGNLPVFSNIAKFAGMASTDWSWSPIMADFDNDGLKDILITNGIKRDLRFTDGLNKIKKSIRSFKQKNPKGELLKNMDALKQLKALPSSKISNYLFKNEDGFAFSPSRKNWGTEQPSFSSGAAVADLDNDGDLDLIVSNMDEPPFIYENQISNGNSLRFKIWDSKNGLSSTTGARVDIFYDGKTQSQSLTLNRGFYSTSEAFVHFGLGQTSSIDSAVITWNAKEQTLLSNLKIGKIITVDKSNASKRPFQKQKKIKSIRNYASNLGLNFKHNENDFDDYEKQILLPHKIGVNNAPIVVADFNNDKKEDVFVGGTAGQSSQLFLQNEGGKLRASSTNFTATKTPEITSAAAIDADNDGDMDLFLATGGNEFPENAAQYADFFYLNNGNGNFSKATINGAQNISASVTVAFDLEGDGDKDLFVGGRHLPGKYPSPVSSQILKNNSSNGNFSFENATTELANELDKIGMVTDAVAVDFDNDGDEDLAVVGEWMPITIFENDGGKLSKVKSDLEKSVGWWMTVVPNDFNGDGKVDLLVGNLGKNSKYKKSSDNNFCVYFNDLDEDGTSDIILSYEKKGKEYPIRGRSCSSQQIPGVANEFPTYHAFASSTVSDIYGEKLEDMNRLEIDNFESVLLINKGNFQFEKIKLPNALQLSSINCGIPIGKNQFFTAGNFNYLEIETPRVDAGYGNIFTFDEKATVAKTDFGSRFSGQIDQIEKINIGGEEYLVYIPIGEDLKLVKTSEVLRNIN